MLVTPARPVALLGPFTSILTTALAPIVLSLELLNFIHVIVGPEANLHTPERLERRTWDLPFVHPPIKRLRADSNELENFRS